MPFSPISKKSGDLIKSDDWNQALTAIVDLFTKFDKATGHNHSGGLESGPPIAEAGIANNAITNAKIADSAVTGAKIANATITAAKVAAGTFSPNIGISFLGTLSDGQTIPPPSGFTAQECTFFVSVTSINCDGTTPTTSSPIGLPGKPGGWFYTVKVDTAGKVTILKSSNLSLTVAGLAMAKKGGW
jgi:hypothetical protein